MGEIEILGGDIEAENEVENNEFEDDREYFEVYN